MNRFYQPDGHPIMCYACGGEWLIERTISTCGGHTPSEVETVCVWCETVVAYWAYGGYDPSYIFEEQP